MKHQANNVEKYLPVVRLYSGVSEVRKSVIEEYREIETRENKIVTIKQRLFRGGYVRRMHFY